MRFNLKRIGQAGLGLLGLLLITAPWAVWGEPARHGPAIVDQDAPADPQADPATGDDNTSGVYVRDSAIATEKLSQAERMQNLKEWGKSADLFQEILVKYKDRVTSSGLDANNRIVQYMSVAERVRQALAHWPPEGLTVYRARYETEAANLLNSAKAGDLNNLHDILQLYFVTDTAKAAGIKLMGIDFEQGDYAAVVQIGQSLLQWHPNLEVERPRVLYRTALAEQMIGDVEAAHHHLDVLKARYPKSIGTIRGEDVVLAESLEQELANNRRVVRSSNDSWTTVGGDASRGKVPVVAGKPGAKLYSITLAAPEYTGMNPAQRAMLLSQDQGVRTVGGRLGVMPVVDHDELFFQDNVHVYAVSLDSGTPLPGWMANHPGNGAYKLPSPATAMPSQQLMCLSVTDQYVVGIMGLPDQTAQMMLGNTVAGGARLVCLDRASGRERWETTVAAAAAGQDSFKSLPPDLSIGGAPLVVGDNVFVAGHGGKGQQFEDCYVLCFNLTSGKGRWASYIASSSSMQFIATPNGMMMSQPATSHLAYDGGRVYVCTELGALACLDAYSGTIVWLDIYREDNGFLPNSPFVPIGGGRFIRPGGEVVTPGAGMTPPWAANPVIVQDGKVFVLPSDLPDDKKSAFVYDAGSGKLVTRIDASDLRDRDSDSTPKLQTLLAATSDYLMLAGPRDVYHVPWRQWNPKRDRPDGFWSNSILPYATGEQQIVGHPFVSSEYCYVSTNRCLFLIDMKKGMIPLKNGAFPPGPASEDYHGTWDAESEGPGNVVVTQDHVIIAGDKRIDIYTDLELARAKMERAIADDPNDPEPRLRYAEVMFATGQLQEAKKRLQEAVDLQGGPEELKQARGHDRTFNDAMLFATKLAAHAGVAPADVNAFFELASHAAATPSQGVVYRAAWASYVRSGPAINLDLAVQLYQEILADDQMRVMPLPDPAKGGSSQASAIAENKLAEIQQDAAGQAAYQRYQDAAQTRFDAAQAAGDPAALLAIAKAYPTATAKADPKQTLASQAMTVAADLFEKQNDPRRAVLVLRQLMIRYHPRSQLPAVYQAMARNYLKLPGGLDAAIINLSRVTAASPAATLDKPLLLPDGTRLENMSVKEAHDQLTALAARIAASTLPRLNLPELSGKGDNTKGPPDPFLPEATVPAIPDIDALVLPADDYARNDRLVTFTQSQGLGVYAVGKGQPLFTCAQVSETPNGCAWLGDRLMVWTDNSVVVMSGQDGSVKSKIKTSDLETIDILPPRTEEADATPTPPMDPREQLAQEQALEMRRRIILELILERQARLRGGPAPVVAPVPAPPDVPVADVGSDAHTVEHIQRVVPLGQSALLATTTGRIMCLDPVSGAIVWQTRVSDHAVDRIVANNEFVALRVQNDQSVELLVLNADSGDLLARRTYSLDQAANPLNLALSGDGKLFYLTAGQLHVIDLTQANLSQHGMDDWQKSPSAPVAINGMPNPANPGSLPVSTQFLYSTLPDQLLVHQDMVIVVSDIGVLVRIYHLDATPWSYTDRDANGQVQVALQTNANGNNRQVSLRVVGNYLYVRSPNICNAYDLQNLPRLWQTPGEQIGSRNYTEALFGKDFVILAGRPTLRLSESNKAPPVVNLECYSRALTTGMQEKGLMTGSASLTCGAGIGAIQAVDGGIVYLTGDHQLHTLLGAGKP